MHYILFELKCTHLGQLIMLNEGRKKGCPVKDTPESKQSFEKSFQCADYSSDPSVGAAGGLRSKVAFGI